MQYGFVGEDESDKDVEAGNAKAIADADGRSRAKPQPEDMLQVNRDLLEDSGKRFVAMK